MVGQSTYKRIPVSPSTWEKLSLIKKPGETFDQLISDLVAEREKRDIIRHAMQVSEEGEYLSLDEAREAWGLNED
ncbi:putative CopG family antitoxin [Methanocalculus alkaliphilus]|uniref:hypothetical protein n=1 Tax=Methanocalculus alkaliphilus TaxID=768730 RepID=UPI0020A0BEFB|nr:hypothetical protein [Methanocalculus alkaliphilus]MCP1716341.1 putative CopG family antitoxin [Methanocalculus alkaliphilus]